MLTPDGSVPIEDLQPGDLVLSRDEHDVDGEVAPQAIEETFVRHGEIYELHIAGQTIRVTPEHPVYIQGRGWTPAGEVVAGDVLSTLHLPVAATLVTAGDAETPPASAHWQSNWQTVESNTSTGEFTTVYNFRVAHWHTYFVGDEGWGLWVHNTYLDQQKRLTQLSQQVRNEFMNDPKSLARSLHDREIDTLVEKPGFIHAFFGTAVERRVAELAEGDQLLMSFIHQRGNKPVDFLDDVGFGIDVTSGSRSSILRHQSRPEINALATYDPISYDFVFDFLKSIGR